MRRIFAILCVVAALAGCGGGDDDGEAVSTSTSTEGSDTTTAPPADTGSGLSADEAQAAADRALLRLDDFPSGWEAAARDDEDDDDEEEAAEAFEECVGADAGILFRSEENELAEAESPTFKSADDEEVEHDVSFAEDEQLSVDAFDVLADPKAPGCLTEMFAKIIEDNADDAPEDVEVGEVTMNQLSFPEHGDRSIAFRATIPLSAEGMEVEVYADLVVFQIGAATVTLDAFSVFSPFDTDELERLAKLAEDRLRSAMPT